MILQLTGEQLHLLRAEAKRSHPIEACALLFGKRDEEKATVKKVVVAPNRLNSPVRFEMDPQLVYSAFEEADQEGLQFIGLFHSHPAPAVPSSVDLKYMELWEDAIWLILSSTDDKAAAFQLIDGRIRGATINLKE
ncbi:MAG: M67 family metallopeptidase [Candidatus Bathyarchaeia archaeon]